MKNAKEFMDDFMETINNMKKYQGIDIMDPNTYGDQPEIVHEAFSFESNIIATVEAQEIIDPYQVEERPKQLLLTKKK